MATLERGSVWGHLCSPKVRAAAATTRNTIPVRGLFRKFQLLVRRHYSRDPYEGSGWWASLNVALAIAHRLRVMSNLVPQEEDIKAWGFLKNALGVLTELTMRNTDLLSVQALLGMVMHPFSNWVAAQVC